MKRKKDFYFLFMLIFVMTFLLIAVYVFLQPEYRNQPSMRDMPSMALMMVLEFARMHEYSWQPLQEVCDQIREQMMGRGYTVPQHQNPVLDMANYVLSLILIACSAGLVGAVSVLALLWIPVLNGERKVSKRTSVLIDVGLTAFTGILLTTIVFVWLQAQTMPKMDLNFWIYSFITFLILLILVVILIATISQGYHYMRKQLLSLKPDHQQKQGGRSNES
ncbi:hypothetical protein [Tuberibacillus sp. Marseille-P3662]|uniref:hypothetical protein n=1 Tax=Tuberibacillus sp. Marseille-P3662 TaxID=1965358 RepID=UPI000A1CD3B6|nr:hypothetical protein [Tuberibacillus sp. Marseille-P3662]